MAPKAPQVAHCEEYDSERGSVMPNTRQEARQVPNTSRPRGSLVQHRTAPREKRSDSGYSSHTSSLPVGNIPATAPAPPVATEVPRPAATPAPKRTKPIVHPSGTEQTRPRSRSTTGTVGECDRPDCQHATCAAVRARADQQYATLRAQVPQPTVNAAMAYFQQQMHMQQQQRYHAANPQMAQSYAVPVLQPAPTRRPLDLPRAVRPVTSHAYHYPIRQSIPAQGPPPSTSAYQNMHYTTAQHQQQYPVQMGAYQPGMRYSSTSISPVTGAYPGYFPVVTSPTSPSFPHPTTVPSNYNTRIHQPGTEHSTRPHPTRPSSFDAKRRTPRTSPMASPRPDRYPAAISTASDSSDSECSSEEDRRPHRHSARDSRRTSSHEHHPRPPLHRHPATSPTLPHRSTSRRDSLHRHDHHRQAALEDLQSSDNMDSDRTQRAQVHQRPRPSTRTSHHRGESSGSSRRPSLSTTASSGRTKATTLSDGSAQGSAYVTVQRRGGRDVTYLSHNEQAALKKSQQREAEVRAYQEAQQGPPAPDLTAETIRLANNWHKRHGSGSKQHSRRSSGESRSHRSFHSRSRSNASQGQEGFRVETEHGTVHVAADHELELRRANGESIFLTATPTATERPEGSRRSSYAGGSKDGDRERGEKRWSFRRGSKDGSEGSRRGRLSVGREGSAKLR